MSTTTLLIDSDIASYIIKARYPTVDARFARADPAHVGVSAVSQSELLYGLKRLSPLHPLQRSVRQFLGSTRTFPWGKQAAEVHADIRHQMMSSGTRIGEMDMMIAAHAISMDAVLVTNNTRHFARLAPLLRIQNWVTDAPP